MVIELYREREVGLNIFAKDLGVPEKTMNSWRCGLDRMKGTIFGTICPFVWPVPLCKINGAIYENNWIADTVRAISSG